MLGIWETEELVRSNRNLLEVDFKREDGEYVVRTEKDDIVLQYLIIISRFLKEE